jgi:two-component system sensor histidine kinase CreC
VARADPLAISRILGNLLDNAATYAPPGTPIRLTAGANGSQAVLAVDDQRPGVPAAARDRIFERHARVHQPTTQGAAGSD